MSGLSLVHELLREMVVGIVIADEYIPKKLDSRTTQNRPTLLSVFEDALQTENAPRFGLRHSAFPMLLVFGKTVFSNHPDAEILIKCTLLLHCKCTNPLWLTQSVVVAVDTQTVPLRIISVLPLNSKESTKCQKRLVSICWCHDDTGLCLK